MQQELMEQLRRITPEEQAILDGRTDLQMDLYASGRASVFDSRKLLEHGRLIDIRPHTRFAHFPKHRHNYVELLYMCSGSTTHIINDTERVTVREGDLIFFHQNVYHEILPAGREDIGVNFLILPEFFDRAITMLEDSNVLREFLLSTISSDQSTSHYLHFQARGIVPVEHLLESMIWTLLNQVPRVNTINQISMGLLFLNLSLFAEQINRDQPGQEEQNTVFYILKYIESHYKSGTLAEVSALLSLPTYTVSRLLKKHTGANFKELLQKRRLQQAAYLLSNTPLTVERILEHIGYDNSSYFHNRFRAVYGCSPRAYRAAHRESGTDK